jgi:hypothetical protein
MSTVNTDDIHPKQGQLFDAEEMRAIARKPVIPATGGAHEARERGGIRALVLRTVARLLHVTIREGE